MYQKIMVPLDGSEMAECVLPHVEAIAKGCHASDVTLVRVVEPLLKPSGEDYVDSEEELEQLRVSRRSAADDYLDRLVSRLKYDGVNIQSEVIVGKTAESLADYAKKHDIDLIIIATHGRSGVSRWVWGSIADRVLRSSHIPVLVVRPAECKPGT